MAIITKKKTTPYPEVVHFKDVSSQSYIIEKKNKILKNIKLNEFLPCVYILSPSNVSTNILYISITTIPISEFYWHVLQEELIDSKTGSKHI